jgi:hypothetical protein
MNMNDPLSLAENCDPQDAFETACRRQLRLLHDENQKLRESLLKHIYLYRVDDDANDGKDEAQRLLELEMQSPSKS